MSPARASDPASAKRYSVHQSEDELPVVQARRVEAHRGRDPRVERRPERQVAADAETHGGDPVDVGTCGQGVQHRHPVGVELRGGRRRGAGQTGRGGESEQQRAHLLSPI